MVALGTHLLLGLLAGRLLVTGEGLAHQTTDLELDGLFGRHFNGGKGLGVLSHPSPSLLHLEDSEIAEFKAVALAQFDNDTVQKTLDNSLHDYTLLFSGIGNLIDQFFFCDGGHATISRKTVDVTRIPVLLIMRVCDSRSCRLPVAL